MPLDINEDPTSYYFSEIIEVCAGRVEIAFQIVEKIIE